MKENNGTSIRKKKITSEAARGRMDAARNRSNDMEDTPEKIINTKEDQKPMKFMLGKADLSTLWSRVSLEKWTNDQIKPPPSPQTTVNSHWHNKRKMSYEGGSSVSADPIEPSFS